jgi:quercetin dioxygenase-like cupin family protein
LPETSLELSAGQWVYLEGGVPHSLRGIEDTSLLLTILFFFGKVPALSVVASSA